ncbi:peptidase M20 domain-containing protein 2 [Galendromus occidentalis]|uniref:Peptidase M20 domain-containing protein 2 n=1 Tax=Galendromus occidentalis TaxID=34638 RepID=A0AAJ7PAE5_9ACAR|nr:peptidase M20 domain-containing protein 2 [Galendromus occidentalis]
MDYSSIDKTFSTSKDLFRSVSSFIHANPELAFEEHRSHEYLVKELEREGFEVTGSYLNCDTAFLATYGKDKGGPTVCIICEYDALPGVGHACGHNLIAEAGFAAGVAVKRFLEDNPSVKGKVVVMGTPAEERGAGKQVLIERGAFTDIDVAMMVHPAASANEIAPLFIGCVELIVEYQGKAAHAAGYPWEGKNALDAAVTCYNGLAMLRQHVRPACKVHAVIKNGGAAANVVPEYASLSIYYRAPTIPELEELGKRVEDCARAGALLSNTEVKLSTPNPKYLPLRTNATLGEHYRKHCEAEGMKFDEDEKLGKFLATSDIGNVSWQVPTIQPIYHIDAKGPNHSIEFTNGAGDDAAQPNTLIAAKAMAKTCVDVLLDPKALQKAREDFKKTQ